jgi:hypothetical protein
MATKGIFMLSSKTALVTGSTSGIGLAIAQTFAKNGANVVINGFGDAEAIEKERAGIEKEHGVKCVYSGADMTKPDEIAAMIAHAEKTFGAVDILVNNAGIQFVSPDRRVPGREMGRDHRDQPDLRLPRDPRCPSGHEKERLGPHHQHGIGPCAGGLSVQVRLCGRQARHRRPDQDGRA